MSEDLETMAREHLERDVERIGLPQDWHGYLTLENLDAVADRIRALLAGRLFTCLYEGEGMSQATLDTSRRLVPAEFSPGHERPHKETGVTTSVSTVEHPFQYGLGALDLHLQNGTWYVNTTITRALAVPGLSKRERERGTRLSLRRDGLTAEFRNFSGERRTWTIRLEDGVLPAGDEE
jgi:hypothetical protein